MRLSEINNTLRHSYRTIGKVIRRRRFIAKNIRYTIFKPVYKSYGVVWASSPNLGDDIQTLAAINLFKTQGITELTFVDRENLYNYSGPPLNLLMNGWFLHGGLFFVPKNINPLFIGFHCERNSYGKVIKPNIPFFKRNAPIGCRDLSTVKILQNSGIEAYFSGCPTLAFDEVTQKNDQTYIVDVDSDVSYIPKNNLNLDKFADASRIEHNIKDKSIINNVEIRLKLAEELLNKYRSAKLVITSRLHCALPCRAFNTDVVFIHKDYNRDPRFVGLQDCLNGYDGGEVGSEVELSYKSADREIIKTHKQFIIEKFSQQIKQIQNYSNLN